MVVWLPAAQSRFLSYGCDWVPLEDSSRVLSFAEPLRCRTPPLPPMPPPSARSPHSHLSPPPSERLEFWRVGVPWGRPFFSSGKGSGEQDSKVILHSMHDSVHVVHVRACASCMEWEVLYIHFSRHFLLCSNTILCLMWAFIVNN